MEYRKKKKISIFSCSINVCPFVAVIHKFHWCSCGFEMVRVATSVPFVRPNFGKAFLTQNTQWRSSEIGARLLHAATTGKT
jgi:hypothetical protein